MEEDKKCYQCAYCNTVINTKETKKWCLYHSVLGEIKEISLFSAKNCSLFIQNTNYIDETYIETAKSYIADQKHKTKNRIQLSGRKTTKSSSLSEIRSDVYNNTANPLVKNQNHINIQKGCSEHQCDKCFYFYSILIAGERVYWCFNKNILKVRNISDGLNCEHYMRQKLPVDIPVHTYTSKENIKRKRLIKKAADIYRFSYKFLDNAAYIISRYGYWLIIRSDNTEKLYHRDYSFDENCFKHGSEYHFQKAFIISSAVAVEMFKYIDNHDKYVIEHRVLGITNDDE